MEELEILESPLIDAEGTGQLLVRFLFNALVTWVIIRFQYYPKSRRCDYFFTFTLIAISVFFLIYLLGGVKLKVGFALGLFAIFGIIRYRTEGMPVREMTYLFVLIALSVINALAVTLSHAELFATNLFFILAIGLCESNRWLRHTSCKIVLYDRIELVKPQCRAALVEDLCNRTGLCIEYTYHTEQSVAKRDGDDGSAKSDELIASKNKHMLRSRFEVEYNIRKSRFTPFASYELYNSLTSGFSYDKSRWTLGTDYKFNKQHSMSFFYRYIDTHDDDEICSHVIGVGYKFKVK